MVVDITRAITLHPIGAKPINADLYNNRGVGYSLMKDNVKAFKDFTTSIVLAPDDPISFINRGYVHYAQGDYRYMILDFNKALTFYPKDVLTHNTPDNLLEIKNILMKMQQSTPVKSLTPSVTTNSIFNGNVWRQRRYQHPEQAVRRNRDKPWR